MPKSVLSVPLPVYVTMLNPDVVFACMTLSILPPPVALASLVVVVAPFAFQFQATYVLELVFTVPSDPNVNPSVPKAVTPPDKALSTL